MTAKEVIEIIEQMDPRERDKIYLHLRRRAIEEEAVREGLIRYANPEKFDEVLTKVMEEHRGLLQRLAEVEAKECEPNRRKREKLKSLGLDTYR